MQATARAPQEIGTVPVIVNDPPRSWGWRARYDDYSALLSPSAAAATANCYLHDEYAATDIGPPEPAAVCSGREQVVDGGSVQIGCVG
jgi:hypothetical protein